MLFLGIILFTILTFIIICTIKCAEVFTKKKHKRVVWVTVLVGNILLFIGMMAAFAFAQSSFIGGLIDHFATMVFMGELIFDVLTLVWVLISRGRKWILKSPQDKSRRLFLKGAAILPLAAGALSLYGGTVEKNTTVVRKFDVPIKSIPDDMKGFSIAQLSDIHLGAFMDLDDLTALLEKTAALGCDILTITGDLFDDNRINFQAAKIVDSYADKFKHGICYCRGNHEHFRGIDAIDTALQETRIRNLVNGADYITGGELPLYIAGVDYPIHRERFQALQETYTRQALQEVPDKSIKVLLAHHPDFFDTAEKYNVDLVLSGHTHGGQIGILGIPLVPPVFKYMRGMYQVGTTLGYVHSGNGSWFPFRLGCPPEIAVFTFVEG